MMNPDCERMRDRILESLYGEIDGVDREGIERHLADCAACREARDRLESARAGLDLLGVPAADPARRDGALAPMRAGEAAGAPGLRPSRARVGFFRIVRLAAAACVLAALGIALWPALSPRPAWAEIEVIPVESGLTVYNGGYALVRDRRLVTNLRRGGNTVRFSDVAARIDPTSVGFRSLTDPAATRVLEQNYEFDLVSSEKVLDRYVDRPVEAVARDGRVHRGTLLARDPESLILGTGEGIEVVSRASLARIVCPELPEGLLTRPTLVWDLDAGREGRHETEIAYTTEGISWRADYVLVLAPDETTADLSAWVTVDNRSGATYRDARLQLVAGDVRRERDRDKNEQENLGGRRYLVRGRGGEFRQQALFEYHLYTLGRPTTLPDHSIKQIELFAPVASVPIEKEYRFAPWEDPKVRVLVRFRNEEEADLGMPLPMGRVRMSKGDAEGSLQFVGEDRIDHTPRDEEIELTLGNAFDLVGERVVVEQHRISDRVLERTIEYRLRNHKEEETVTIHVLDRLGANWELLDFPADLAWEAHDGRADTIEIPVEVPPGRDGRVFRYRIRWTQP